MGLRLPQIFTLPRERRPQILDPYQRQFEEDPWPRQHYETSRFRLPCYGKLGFGIVRLFLAFAAIGLFLCAAVVVWIVYHFIFG